MLDTYDTWIVIVSLLCAIVVSGAFLAALLGWSACKLGSDDDDLHGRG